MTAEQQLERSVLEGKERDELQAIAQALSVKTNTRTKKADMIDGILKATGVSVDDNTSPNPNVSGVDGGPASNGAASPNGSAAGSRRGTRPNASSEDTAEDGGTRSDEGEISEGSSDPDGSDSSGRRPGRRRPAVQTFSPTDDVDQSGSTIELDDDFDSTPGSENGTEGDEPGGP